MLLKYMSLFPHVHTFQCRVANVNWTYNIFIATFLVSAKLRYLNMFIPIHSEKTMFGSISKD